MSRFDAQFAALAVPGLFDRFGRVVTYRPHGADDVSLTAIVGPERTEEIDTPNGTEDRQVINVTVATDPASVYGGIASPDVRDRVVIGGYTWSVETIDSVTGSTALLLLVRATPTELTRMRYRTPRGG